MKTYILQKDLPDYKAGEPFTFNERHGYYEAESKCKDGCRGRWPPSYVEDNPEWFTPKHENTFSISYTVSVHNKTTDTTGCRYHNFIESKVEPTPQQFGDIKKAIERILNPRSSPIEQWLNEIKK